MEKPKRSEPGAKGVQKRGNGTVDGPNGNTTSRKESRWAITAAVVLILAAFSSSISQLMLAPVYGSIPSSRFHQTGITGAAILAVFTKPYTQRYLSFRPLLLLPIISAWSPLMQYFLFPYSSQLGLPWGPIATELATCFPLVYVAMVESGCILDNIELSDVSPALLEMLPVAISFLIFSAGRTAFDKLVQPFIGTSASMGRARLQMAVTGAYAAIAPSKLLLLALPAVLHTVWFNPNWMSEHSAGVLEKGLATSNFTLLERKESITGYISVLEGLDDEFRVLRCDHSLLGGEWLVTPRSRKQGQRVKETVYSIFTMMEAVRLVESEAERLDKESSALFIGLGIGTSPKAFIEHGINTTIVELDPVVHEFATKYFDLPGNHIAHLQDAVPFVRDNILTHPSSYDYIIHDVFTGGAEPTVLFTIEFLIGLGLLLKDDGVIAINYAGDLTMPPPKIVLRTIYEVFPTCRIFRDTDPKEINITFVNMVVFCTKQENGTISFRNPVPGDHLDSISRRQWVPPNKKLELFYDSIVSEEEKKSDNLILRRGSEEVLEKYHQASAAGHWKIMRTVLPDAVWELW